MITKRIVRLKIGDIRKSDEVKISKLMTQPVLTIDEHSKIRVVQLISKEQVGSIIVTRKDVDAEIITAKDILSKVIAQELSESYRS